MKSRFIQNSFTSGVLSALLKGRSDINQYYNGLETAENWMVIPQGGIKRRAGTRYIDTAAKQITRDTVLPTMPNGGVPANINDGSTATSTSTTVAMGTTDPYVVCQTDLGSSKTVKFVDVLDISLGANSDSGFRIDGSDDAASWINVASFPTDITTTAQSFRFEVSGTPYRYWRLRRSGAADLGADVTTLSEFNLYTEDATLSNVKVESFSVSTTEHYVMVFTDGNCSIYSKKDPDEVDTVSTFKAAIPMPYSSAEVSAIRTVQTENVMLVFHEDHPTKRIINYSPTHWAVDDFPYTNIPEFDFNDDSSPTPTNEVQVLAFSAGWNVGDTYQIDIEGVLSKNITFAGDGTADEQSSTAFNLEKNLQDMPVFGDTGVSVTRTGALQYTVTISGESTKPFELFSGFPTAGTASKTLSFTKTTTGVARKEPVWSSTRGYPKMGAFHEGRLVLGGTKAKPQSLFYSKSGVYYDFDLDESDDNDAIFITIASRTLTDIVDVVSGRDLQVFTDGGEFVQFVSPVTPQTANLKSQDKNGSIGIEAVEVDGATLFVTRNGKSIKQFVYNFNEDAYAATDISVLCPELISNPVDIEALNGSNSEDANWIFIVNDDGNMTVLNTLREQDINAFTTWTTNGDIVSCATVDDQFYMVAKRTVNGSETYHIEQMSFSRYLDDSLLQVNSAPLTTISGLDHLEGLTVGVVADGSVLPDRTVTSGAITLTTEESAHTNVEVGLRYTCTLKPMPINTNVGSGQNFMRRRKIVRMNVRVKDAYGLYIEGNPIPDRSFDEAASSPLGNAPDARTGIIEDVFSGKGWDRYDDMPEFTLPDPTPCTILAIEYEVESS